MTVQTAAGTRIYIGGKTESDPQNETSWNEIGEVVNFPNFGRVYNLVTHNPVNNRKTFKFKGSYNDGSLDLEIGRDTSDAGQAAAKTALDDDDAYNFKIELGDDPGDDTGDEPTTFYFRGRVFSYTTNIGSVDSIVGANLMIEIDGSITEVAAVDV